MIVFDMAGTTIDEGNAVYKTVQKVVNDGGYAASLDEVLLLGAGKEKLQAITDILKSKNPDQDVDEEAFQLFQKFKVSLEETYMNLEIKPFSDAENVFGLLKQKNIKVVLNTGYDYVTASTLLKKINWKMGREYDALITADDVKNGRPAPDMILKAMALFQIINPDEVIKVGDSIVDIEEGKAANCGIVIGVTTGAQTRKQLNSASPSYVFDNLTALLEII
ncbi:MULTISPECIES: HAD hydrolase-like protein [unclassified Flavobacterium]|uniref:HAD hydrolase-like protein n=1 Tax=unclassified Flavobacterium TaxID=196869 RepID=UPI0032E480DB